MVAAVRAGDLSPLPHFPGHSAHISHSPRMAMVQDMADCIVDLVHDDPKTLLRVSLVSRVWVSRTRPYLFKSLKITDSKLRYLDPYCLPPLCKYVKTLYFTWTTTIEPRHILRWFERSEPHTLVVHSLQLHGIDEQTVRQSFAKFPSTSITTLDLRDISPTKKTLLTFLSLFPNTNNLTISINEWKKDQPNSKGTKKRGGRQKFGPPSISTTRSSNVFPLRASGSFKCFDPPSRVPWGCDRGQLLLTIATLPLQFHTVSLDIKEQSWAEIGAFLDSCSKTVRKLFLVLPSRKPWPCVLSTVPHAQCANATQEVPRRMIGQIITILQTSRDYAFVHQPITLLPNTFPCSCVRSNHHVYDE